MAFRHGVRRVAGGGVRLRLGVRERDVLATLPDRLRPLLAGDSDLVTDLGRVRDRLFPDAYPDPLDEMEYRELVGSSVSDERLAAVDAFAATLRGGDVRRSTWTRELTADEAHAWLSAVNDARLTLAMVVGVDDESAWQRGPRRGDLDSALLWYLGWLQEELLGALAGALDDAPRDLRGDPGGTQR